MGKKSKKQREKQRIRNKDNTGNCRKNVKVKIERIKPKSLKDWDIQIYPRREYILETGEIVLMPEWSAMVGTERKYCPNCNNELFTAGSNKVTDENGLIIQAEHIYCRNCDYWKFT